MSKPKREFVSITEAVRIYNDTSMKTSIEELCSFIEDGLLPCYVTMLSGTTRRYYKVIDPRWNAETLNYCQASIVDKAGSPTDGENRVMYYSGARYSEVFIMPIEYEKVVEIKSNSDGQPVQESIEELCKRLKLDGWPEKNIAKELKRVFPHTFPSKIGRLLPAAPDTNIQPDSHRKRGVRLLK